MFKDDELRNAVFLGSMCIVSYLGCYFARNVLSVVSPQMLVFTGFTVEFIGMLSTGYMFTYAFGQLLNGRIGVCLAYIQSKRFFLVYDLRSYYADRG